MNEFNKNKGNDQPIFTKKLSFHL